ncbi:MAG: hypothetical protein OEZ47_17305 [Gammaproteobacteria bacterium]|nr:hypothetical protein [Gammaproteobacteria bacterium]
MGGIGSGRHSRLSWKDTTDDYRSLDIRRLKRDGLLEPEQRFGWQWSRLGSVIASINIHTKSGEIILSYRQRNTEETEWQDEKYSVYLDYTPCHLGGERPWFLCPARGCGKRVAILYGGAIFACRRPK